tara:strand:+ start:1299 stop:1703 length:405 start_codon:yes stop_codon:yes gene_type:complete
MFFIALMLTGQLFAQMEEGLYYCTDAYICDVDNYKIVKEEKLDDSYYIDVFDHGVRFYPNSRLGVYYSWLYIGKFNTHETYILTNGGKFCIAPEINGVYYFFEYTYDTNEFKNLIKFQNILKVSDEGGNYIMER